MKLAIIVAASLSVGGLARADSHCSVDFVVAPDYVRDSIEAYLEKEPHCGRAIQLRIVPTDDGQLYLMAVRPDGRVHERTVPSASAAAVLVASWVADDWWFAPRETAPARAVPDATAITASFERPHRDATRSVQLAWLSAPGSGRDIQGVRAEIDVLGRGNDGWHLGVAGALHHARSREDLPTRFGVHGEALDSESDELESTDWRLMGTVSYRNTIGDRLEIGASVGYGVVFLGDTWQHSLMEGGGPPLVVQDVHGDDTTRTFEVGLTAGVHVTRSLGISLGWYAATFQRDFAGPNYSLHRQGDASFALSARIGL